MNFTGMKRHVIAGCAFLATLPLAAAVVTPTVELTVAGNDLTLVNRVKPMEWTTARLALSVFEGKTKKLLSGDVKVTDRQDGSRGG